MTSIFEAGRLAITRKSDLIEDSTAVGGGSFASILSSRSLGSRVVRCATALPGLPASVAAKLDLIPIALPLLAPGEGSPARLANLFG